jgi:hypothetical protein
MTNYLNAISFIKLALLNLKFIKFVGDVSELNKIGNNLDAIIYDEGDFLEATASTNNKYIIDQTLSLYHITSIANSQKIIDKTEEIFRTVLNDKGLGGNVLDITISDTDFGKNKIGNLENGIITTGLNANRMIRRYDFSIKYCFKIK